MQTLQAYLLQQKSILYIIPPTNSTSVNAASSQQTLCESAYQIVYPFTHHNTLWEAWKSGRGAEAGSGHDLPQVEIACHMNRTHTDTHTYKQTVLGSSTVDTY